MIGLCSTTNNYFDLFLCDWLLLSCLQEWKIGLDKFKYGNLRVSQTIILDLFLRMWVVMCVKVQIVNNPKLIFLFSCRHSSAVALWVSHKEGRIWGKNKTNSEQTNCPEQKVVLTVMFLLTSWVWSFPFFCELTVFVVLQASAVPCEQQCEED